MASKSLLRLMLALTFLITLNCAQASSLQIAMVLWRGETAAEVAFKEALREQGLEVQYHYFNAGQNRSRLAGMLRDQLLPDLGRYDYIYCFGTTATQMTLQLVKGRVPILFNAVTDPLGAGIGVQERSSADIAGISSGIPIEQQVELLQRFLSVKRLGYLFNPREKNSVIILDQLEQLAEKNGFSVVRFRVPGDSQRLLQQLEQLNQHRPTINALYLPLDSFLLSNSAQIEKALLKLDMPALAAHQDYIRHGALLGVVPDYAELGSMAASIIHKHQQGRAFDSFGIQQVSKPIIMLNRRTLERLEINLPDLPEGHLIIVD